MQTGYPYRIDLNEKGRIAMSNASNALKDAYPLVVAVSLLRSAELLRNPSDGSSDEREMLSRLLEKMGKEGVAQESLRLATQPQERA